MKQKSKVVGVTLCYIMKALTVKLCLNSHIHAESDLYQKVIPPIRCRACQSGRFTDAFPTTIHTASNWFAADSVTKKFSVFLP